VRRRLSTLAALLATTLALGTVATVAPAHADDPTTGTVTVTVVDDHGRSDQALIALIATDGTFVSNSGTPGATATIPEVSPGRYAVVGVTRWAGLGCFGITPCDMSLFTGGSAVGHAISGVLTVKAGATSSYTYRSATPRVTPASPTPGATARLAMPAGYRALTAYMETVSNGMYPASQLQPGVAWLRNGQATGRSGATYATSAADLTKRLSARLTYNTTMAQTIMGSLFTSFPGLTTDAVVISKATSSIALTLPKKVKAHQRKAVGVTLRSSTGAVSGWVTVKVGKKKVRVPVLNGAGRIKLPKLSAGRYKVRATWSGTAAISGATSKTYTLRVR
jgi:hypothetical protein